MPKKDEAIERVAAKIVLATNHEEVIAELNYLWNESIQQTFGTTLQEIVAKTTKALLETEWGDLYLKWLDENYGKVNDES